MARLPDNFNKAKILVGVVCLLILGIACNYSKNFATQPVEEINNLPVGSTETPFPTNTLIPTITPSQTRLSTKTMTPTPQGTWMPYPTRTLRPTWTPSLTLSPTATPEVSPILKEDFSDPMTPWLKTKSDNYEMGIAGGKYYMKINKGNVEITSSRSWLKLAEVRIEADIIFGGGEGYVGFSCRESTSSYYTAFITSDGYYGLGQTRNGKVSFLVYQKSPVIKVGKNVKNHVRGDCRGNTITLFVNDKALAQKKIEGIGPGYVGMMAGTFVGGDKQKLTVYFDNLVIWGP